MSAPRSAQHAVCRLLASAWEPEGLPAPESIPWADVLRIVEPSNLGGLLYIATQALHSSLPAEIRQALEDGYYLSLAANARHLHQLAQVGQALSSVGAPLLLLKGAALAETLYDNLAQRLMGDIDLAVAPAHVAACREALLRLGYIAGQAQHRPGSLQAFSNQELFEPPPPHRATVELHWHVLDVAFYLRTVPMDWFWAQTQVRSIAAQPFRILNPEANVIYLSAHMALHHRFQKLHPFFDLALVLLRNGHGLDWDRIVAAAQSFELVSVLRETLDRLAQCWPSLPIGEPLRRLRMLRPSRIDERLFRLLTAEARSTTLDFYTTLVSLPGFSTRARFAWHNLFPQPAYMMGRYRLDANWQLPYRYLYRLAHGLPRLARILRQARRLERGQR